MLRDYPDVVILREVAVWRVALPPRHTGSNAVGRLPAREVAGDRMRRGD